MAEISLVVTAAALKHISQGNQNQAQIAIRSPSPDIVDRVRQLTAKNGMELKLGGCIVLTVRDSGAIWRAHNDQHVEDFDALFDLLARRADHEMRFLCEILG